jgi:hypothetical protein
VPTFEELSPPDHRSTGSDIARPQARRPTGLPHPAVDAPLHASRRSRATNFDIQRPASCAFGGTIMHAMRRSETNDVADAATD